jgi:hypothetical protein
MGSVRMDLPMLVKVSILKMFFLRIQKNLIAYWTCTVNATGVATEALAHQLLIQQLRPIRALQVVLVFLGVVSKRDSNLFKLLSLLS